MAYEVFDVDSPNQLLQKMRDYIVNQGYTVVQDITADFDIYNPGQQINDGNKFVFKDTTGDYFIILRSCNGYPIFGDNSTLDLKTRPEIDNSIGGVGCTIAEGYSRTVRWFAQYNAPVKHGAQNFVLGTALLLPPDDDYKNHIKLYCNRITSPTETLVFNVVKHVDGHPFYKVSTLIIGNLRKYDTWDGGIFMSSNVDYTLSSGQGEYFKDSHFADYNVADGEIGVVLGNGNRTPHTFLRIDIDDAPDRKILWACDIDDNEEGTGKHLALPIRRGSDSNPKIPHYGYLQSQGYLDFGSNHNTLNNITINMPIYMAVKVDPDVLGNYAAVGFVSGVYFISSGSTQTTGVYEIDYPESGTMCQVFSLTSRRGKFGFDALSIKQE